MKQSSFILILLLVLIACTTEDSETTDDFEVANLTSLSDHWPLGVGDQIIGPSVPYRDYQIAAVSGCQCRTQSIFYSKNYSVNQIEELRKAWLYYLNDEGSVFFNYAYRKNSLFFNRDLGKWQETWLLWGGNGPDSEPNAEMPGHPNDPDTCSSWPVDDCSGNS